MKKEQLLQKYLCLAIFVFPILAPSVRHAASGVYIALLVPGILLGWPAWSHLHKWEKLILKGFILFFLAGVVSLVNTQDLKESLKFLDRYLRFPLAIPAYLILRRFAVPGAKHLLAGMPIAACVVFGQAVYQVYPSPLRRAEGAYHPIVFGDITVWIASIFFCGALVFSRRRWHLLLAFLLLVLSLYATVLSVTRGALLFTPLMMLVPVFLGKGKCRKRAIVIGLALLVLVPVLGFIFLPEIAKIRYSSAVAPLYYLSDGSTNGGKVPSRILIWRDAWRIFLQSPLLGVGMGDFERQQQQLIRTGISKLSSPFTHAHSIYLDTLARTGILGFSALIAFLFVLPFRAFYQLRKDVLTDWGQFCVLGGIMTLLSFAVFGLTEDWLARMPLTITFVVSLTVFMTSLANEIVSSHPSPPPHDG